MLRKQLEHNEDDKQQSAMSPRTKRMSRVVARVCATTFGTLQARTAVTFVPELRKTVTGKVQKYVLGASAAAIAKQ